MPIVRVITRSTDINHGVHISFRREYKPYGSNIYIYITHSARYDPPALSLSRSLITDIRERNAIFVALFLLYSLRKRAHN